MAAGDATYATQADYVAYYDGADVSDPAAVKRLLERAERDIDSVVGAWMTEDNGLKFGTPTDDNEKALEDWQIDALSRATCAQAQYRSLMGEDFMARGQHASATGPDFSVTGKLPKVGPEAVRELESGSLFRLMGRGRSSSRAVAGTFFDTLNPLWRRSR